MAVAEQTRTGPPDFVGVGTQRSGTTWWFKLLVAHPEIRAARGRRKEQHFFDRFGACEMTSADVEAYHHRFPRRPGQLAGEWTPRYMRDFWTPPLLARAAPDARLLMMLRDPVERYRSAIRHRLDRYPDRPLETLATEAAEGGRYAMQLERILEHFPRERVLVLQYERCRLDPAAQYVRTLEFLGVSPDVLPEDFTETRGKSTAGTKSELAPGVVAALQDVLSPDVERLQGLVEDLDLGLWPHFSAL